MIILGLDPGIAITGFGVIKIQNPKPKIQKLRQKKESQSEALKLIDYGCIMTEPNLNTSKRLLILAKELKKIIKKYKPNLVTIEDIFFFKNLKTVIKVSEARGVLLLIAGQAKLSVLEFTPLEVKQAVVGYGRAEKKQVQEMVKILLKLKDIPRPDDAADALAVAICCGHSVNSKLTDLDRNTNH